MRCYLHCTVLRYIQTPCVSKGNVITLADWISQGWDLPAGIEQLLQHSSCCLPKINSIERSSFPFALTNTRPVRTNCIPLWLDWILRSWPRERNRGRFLICQTNGNVGFKRKKLSFPESRHFCTACKAKHMWQIRWRENADWTKAPRCMQEHAKDVDTFGLFLSGLTHCWLSNMKVTNHTSSQDWAWRRVRLI